MSCLVTCTVLAGEFVCYRFENKEVITFGGMLDTETLEQKKKREELKRRQAFSSMRNEDDEEGAEMVTKKQAIPEIV